MMELQAPDTIRIGSESRALLRDLEDERQLIREMGEFPAEVQEELRKAFLPERIADTLTIEGVRVNPRVTRSVLTRSGGSIESASTRASWMTFCSVLDACPWESLVH